VLAASLNQTLLNLADITSNLNTQVQTNDQMLGQISRLVVDADGRTSLDGETLPLQGLRDQLRRLKSLEPDLRVVVKADDEADYQGMVSVLDALRQLDITRVGLATDASSR